MGSSRPEHLPRPGYPPHRRRARPYLRRRCQRPRSRARQQGRRRRQNRPGQRCPRPSRRKRRPGRQRQLRSHQRRQLCRRLHDQRQRQCRHQRPRPNPPLQQQRRIQVADIASMAIPLIRPGGRANAGRSRGIATQGNTTFRAASFTTRPTRTRSASTPRLKPRPLGTCDRSDEEIVMARHRHPVARRVGKLAARVIFAPFRFLSFGLHTLLPSHRRVWQRKRRR